MAEEENHPEVIIEYRGVDRFSASEYQLLESDPSILSGRKASEDERAEKLQLQGDNLTPDEAKATVQADEVEEDESAHIELQNLLKRTRNFEPIPDNIEEQYISKYLLVNFVYVVLGAVSLIITLALHRLESSMKDFLFINHTQSFFPAALMYTSSILSIIIGLTARICFMRNKTGFFQIYEKFAWIVLAMNLSSILMSLGSWKHLNITGYERMFEAQAIFVRTGNKTYLDYWGSREDFWDDLQKSLKCCGMHHPIDWFTLTNNFVDSCCRASKMDICIENLTNWRVHKNMSEVNVLMEDFYEKDCASVLKLEIINFQRDWVLFPSIIAFFNFLLMLNGNHFNRKIWVLYRSVYGLEFITDYQKKHFPKCCSVEIPPKTPRVFPLESEYEEDNQKQAGSGSSPDEKDTKILKSPEPESDNKPGSDDPQPGFSGNLYSSPPVVESKPTNSKQNLKSPPGQSFSKLQEKTGKVEKLKKTIEGKWHKGRLDLEEIEMDVVHKLEPEPSSSELLYQTSQLMKFKKDD